jgi:hypothetical protein
MLCVQHHVHTLDPNSIEATTHAYTSLTNRQGSVEIKVVIAALVLFTPHTQICSLTPCLAHTRVQAQLFVVVQHSVHILNPNGIYRPIKYQPPASKINTLLM